jgi:hypothetical protein
MIWKYMTNYARIVQVASVSLRDTTTTYPESKILHSSASLSSLFSITPKCPPPPIFLVNKESLSVAQPYYEKVFGLNDKVSSAWFNLDRDILYIHEIEHRCPGDTVTKEILDRVRLCVL